MTDRRIVTAVAEALRNGLPPSEDLAAATEALAHVAIDAYETTAAQVTTLDQPSRFVVKGASVFPIDMLRHDHCWPVGGDFNRINFKPLGAGEATIELCAQFARCITPLRWASFGWTVTEIGGQEVIWENGRPRW